MRKLFAVGFALIVGATLSSPSDPFWPQDRDTQSYFAVATWAIAAALAYFVLWPFGERAELWIVGKYRAARARLIAWLGSVPVLRHLLRFVHEPMTGQALQVSIERGRLLQYGGTVNRRFAYKEGTGWGNQSRRLIVPFALQRHTMAMTPREREAVRIFNELRVAGALRGADADDIWFGLVYGDGNAVVSGDSFRAPLQLMQQNGFRTLSDLVRTEAGYRHISREAAITRLLSLLQAEAGRRRPNPAIVELYQSIAGGAY